MVLYIFTCFIQLARKPKKPSLSSISVSAGVLAWPCSAEEQKKLRKVVAVITLAEIEQHASLPFFR